MRTDERIQLWASRIVVWIIIALVFFPIWGVLAVALSATGGTGGELIPQNPTGSNFLDVTVRVVRDRVVVLACEDNLVRGASGVAVQNFNRMFGYDEKTALL